MKVLAYCASLSGGPFAKATSSAASVFLFAAHADGSVSFNGMDARGLDFSSAGFGARLACKDPATIGPADAEPLTLPVCGMDTDPIFTVSWALKHRPE